MHLTYRNVNDAFRGLVETFAQDGYKDKWVIRESYSNPNGSGTVLRIDEPVLITYTHPTERVLFNAVRDANPWLHLYEALYHLAGRNNVAPLAYYCKNIAQYSDNGRTFNGAYGYRWRHSDPWVDTDQRPAGWSDGRGGVDYNSWEKAPTDQLKTIISHLRENPNSRRAVLSMWNVEDDLLKIGTSKDVCCNTQVIFSLRNFNTGPGDYGDEYTKYLDITVTNRSNDLLWGLLGTNYVTFSILQEYVAAHLGVQVGRYHHMTNNLHVYETRKDWKPEEMLAAEPIDYRGPQPPGNVNHAYCGPVFKPIPLISDPETFDREVVRFVDYHNGWNLDKPRPQWSEPFLSDVADPVFVTYHHYKGVKAGDIEDRGDMQDALNNIKADDWRIACSEWLKRRVKSSVISSTHSRRRKTWAGTCGYQ